jgi:hypothetical protein
LLDEKQIAALKDQHGQDLVLVESNDGDELVFKKPARMEYNRWFNKRGDDPSAACLQLAAACLVHPSYDQMIAVLDKHPALLMKEGGVQSGLVLLAGIGDEVRKPKKL